MKIREIIKLVADTASSNKKKEILEANKSDLLDLIFADTYDKSRNYYVKKYNKDCGGEMCLFDGFSDQSGLTIDSDYAIFHELLDMLHMREFTGNEAIAQVEDTIAMFCEEDRWVLHLIMERNLKIGIAMDSFNKVSDNEIEKFEVALAYNLDKVKNVNPIDGTYFASRKLDGVRCIAIVDTEKNNVEFYSRQGKQFTSLNHLVKPMLTLCDEYSGKMVFDGELCYVDADGNENFSMAVQKVSKKGETATGIKYCIFDVIPYKAFIAGKDTCEYAPTFSARYELYKDLYYNHVIDEGVYNYISILFQERITTQEQFDKWSNDVKDWGWEGFMLRKDMPYQSGRIKDLIKVKKFLDAEYIVKDITTGKACYNEDGMKEYDIVSGLIIEHKGNQVTVGSGLSKEQRLTWYKDPTKIIGKTITVQYFEETTNKKDDSISLRFPVLKHVYEAERDC